MSPDALAAENDRLEAELAAARVALTTAEARERARIADDLHDILGHALEVVAFKAELADRVVRSDAGRARRELIEIQRVARSAMNDVRGLARSRRPTDLADELAGAVTLFHSAGVEVAVSGDAGSVSHRARDPLARTLREAVTNVLRHSAPTRCSITVEEHCFEASVTVVNDGAEAGTALSSGGSGLAGLSRLLAEHGGGLSAGHHGCGYFAVRATVATRAPAEVAAVPARAPQPRRANAVSSLATR
ncbi:sensor histidine kinase [uncultured Jatrophihabitans sp.]|uniref:sensor histidine kinase n=1 Tax=uncultured Jatrophihabitans sp. TaxID=1610747 RepID=UPI0035CA5AE1